MTERDRMLQAYVTAWLRVWRRFMRSGDESAEAAARLAFEQDFPVGGAVD